MTIHANYPRGQSPYLPSLASVPLGSVALETPVLGWEDSAKGPWCEVLLGLRACPGSEQSLELSREGNTGV